MSSPRKRTLPSTRVFGTSSCIRLSERSKLDLPHPLGPMMAVIFFAGIATLTSSIAFFSPYQSDRFSISNAGRSVAADGLREEDAVWGGTGAAQNKGRSRRGG